MKDNSCAAVLSSLSVSRETEGRLEGFVDLLKKWNAAINLVSKTTIDQVWQRHILDSVQVFDHGMNARRWLDIGSGGGFPGLVVAILAAEKTPDMQVTLVESDQRKATFLRTVCQSLGLKAIVLSDRVEVIAPQSADVISARALAPLPQLCAFAQQHLVPRGTAIFLKGKSFAAEVAEARQNWNFALESHPSITDPSAVVLVLKGISHV
jgi:16S rRNA (guanine527-N7)-methyltransferase